MTDDNYVLYPDTKSPSQLRIAGAMIEIGQMLLKKNTAHNNRALNPPCVHSSSSTVEQLKVRADDRLVQLTSINAYNDHLMMEYIGYLVLLMLAERTEAALPAQASFVEDRKDVVISGTEPRLSPCCDDRLPQAFSSYIHTRSF